MSGTRQERGPANANRRPTLQPHFAVEVCDDQMLTSVARHRSHIVYSIRCACVIGVWLSIWFRIFNLERGLSSGFCRCCHLRCRRLTSHWTVPVEWTNESANFSGLRLRADGGRWHKVDGPLFSARRLSSPLSSPGCPAFEAGPQNAGTMSQVQMGRQGDRYPHAHAFWVGAMLGHMNAQIFA